MNNTRTTTLLSITLSAVLLTGLIAPSMPKAFAGDPCAGGFTALDDICVPPFAGNPNSVTRGLADLGVVGDQGTCTDVLNNADFFLTTTLSSEGPSIFQLWPQDIDISEQVSGVIDVFMPNFIDPLAHKDMRVQLTFCPITSSPQTTPFIDNVIGRDDANGANESNDCQSIGGNTLPADTVGALYFYEDFHCEPNPDFETFQIHYATDEWLLVQIVVDTWSYDDDVGGIFEGVNTASLLLAGAQLNAMWLIPLITAISVVGIVIVKRKPFF